MLRVICASLFSPRGGSAHVLRALARELPAHGWDVTVLSGSRGDDPDGHGDARRFYAGLDVRTVDFTAALAAEDPLDPPGGVAPMHPSYEDRPDAPDPVFARLDDAALARQVDAWADALEDAGAPDADVLHLSHLTPLHEAAARVAPDVPVVGHLHGTELLMLERIAADEPSGWPHADAWAGRLRDWAQACTRVVVLSEGQRLRAAGLLGIDPDRCVVVPNGYDARSFAPAAEPVDRVAVWRPHLVDRPRGWRPGGGAGSVAYAPADLEVLRDAPILLYVGRFTAVKRIGLLIEAHARMRTRAALVIVGGHPGEWEGEHPAQTIERIGARDVLLAGWHDHDALPGLLQASDALILASVREQFGQVLVEAMACGVVPIAVDRFGPADIVEDGETGWLVEPDDRDALTAALDAAASDPVERRRRGDAARRDAHARFRWEASGARMSGALHAALVAVGATATMPRGLG